MFTTAVEVVVKEGVTQNAPSMGGFMVGTME